MVMWSQCVGVALEPPVWIVPNKALSQINPPLIRVWGKTSHVGCYCQVCVGTYDGNPLVDVRTGAGHADVRLGRLWNRHVWKKGTRARAGRFTKYQNR